MNPTQQEPVQERDLIARAPDDPEAFRCLYDLYFPRVYSYIRYRVGHTQSAEDVVADVFLKVVRGLADFQWRHEGSFASWVFRIAHNETQSYHRRNGVHDEPVPLEELPEISSSEPMPEEAVLRNEKGESLRRIILTLPRRRQEVITLRFFGELQNREIAAVLDLDERTVASHLCRGLRDLHAKWLEELSRDDDEGRRTKDEG